MSVVKGRTVPLSAGDTLTWEEFEERWDATPEVKFAELIGGKVYMTSPLSDPHGEMTGALSYWAIHYAVHTPGCKAASNATVRILADAPQPDVYLCLRESHGGQSRVRGKFLIGAPELVVEVCLSSAAHDLHEKKDLYERAGVKEYMAVLLYEEEVRWYRLEAGKYVLLKPAAKGIFHSVAFPGLWLDAQALLACDFAAVIPTLERGLGAPEHADFVRKLEKQRGKR